MGTCLSSKSPCKAKAGGPGPTDREWIRLHRGLGNSYSSWVSDFINLTGGLGIGYLKKKSQLIVILPAPCCHRQKMVMGFGGYILVITLCLLCWFSKNECFCAVLKQLSNVLLKY